jgi:hypothetical protein
MFFLEFAQSPDYDFINIFYDLFLCSFGILLPMFKKKQKNQTNLSVDPDIDVVGGLSNKQETTFLFAKHLSYLECSEWFVATYRPNA